MPMEFINTYTRRLPARFYEQVTPTPAPAPRLIAWSRDLARHLGFDSNEDPERLRRWFGGNEPIPGSDPVALAYAGHQFGHFVPQLGDGRAALLGEARSPVDGKGYDLQLKGSGPTPFSRRGDGKSSLGPVIREYLLSEAMHRLGVPTTRALAAVGTGEWVLRDGPEPGGVLTRVAAGHIRVGTFQYFAARGDKEALQRLTGYAIERHYPQVSGADRPVAAFYGEVVKAQARLVAHWMALGFIHGVMNTDNMAISGETLDYGPCAFLDEFHPYKVFSSIDHQGRYAYGNQANMAQWNLARLAECLLQPDEATQAFEDALAEFKPVFSEHYHALMRARLGLRGAQPEDAGIITAWLRYLQDGALDYHRQFVALEGQLRTDAVEDIPAFTQPWLRRIDQQSGGRDEAVRLMAANNPRYVPRNHQVERAIQAVFRGDDQVFEELHQVLSDPYDEHPGLDVYKQPPREEERVEMTFCGT